MVIDIGVGSQVSAAVRQGLRGCRFSRSIRRLNGILVMLRQRAHASVDRIVTLAGPIPLGPLPATTLLLLIGP